jgi:hypothetical protein
MARRNRYQEAQAKIDRAMVDGVGGLKFVAQAPPGLGRLIRIPFYFDTDPGFAAPEFAHALDGTDVTASEPPTSTRFPGVVINPAAAAASGGPPATGGATAVGQMHTPQISWATLRLVGFEVVEYVPLQQAATPPAELAFADLKIGGGATLFVHEDFGPASIYLAGQDSFPGLRDYPILESPNVAEVEFQAIANAPGPVTSPRISFSCSLVCEILTDDNYGAHVPGPYARAGALVRQGGSFINR